MARLQTYEAVVEKYKWGERLNTIREPEYFEKAPSLLEAIKLVAEARKENGALFKHQRHLEDATAEQVKLLLLSHEMDIAQVEDFEGLITLVQRLVGRVTGVKEMYIYDAALRLGAYLRKLPVYVYLHRGTRLGAEALELETAGRRYLRVEEFPTAFQVLKPHEIEDLLCIFKDDLKRIRLAQQRSNERTRR